ncbi:E3 ubiquitin/ISG15 ligase TRIM25-like isoform X2 [Chanodichthys erythropterus]|uniref:E3 ubiquitin/ISG15 ligase TRIM25-like isoform X2 n=1 Tax=Chanodichthys erythropterus TaxID=933992 RepID=UPI00351ED4F4
MAEAALALCCSVCLHIPRDPMTIPCGHNYCKSCITDHWDAEYAKERNYRSVYTCPHPRCIQTFRPHRPNPSINTELVDLIEKLKNMMPEATLCYAEPDDVPCDVCTERKYKAVKFCSVCVVSFCELHLKPHRVSAAYEGHKLITASCAIKETICSVHKKPLEVYCQTDKEFACLLCVLEEHRGHEVVSAATERQAKRKEIEEMQSNSKSRIQRRESELTELTTSVETIRRSAQEAVGDMEKACSDLTDSIKAQCSEMIHLIRGQEETAVSQAEKLQEQLQQELSELQQRDANIQMLLSSEDDFLILQSIRSLSNPQKCENSPRVNMSCDGLFGQVRKSISDRKDKMMDLLEENRVQLSEEVQKVQVF